MLENKRGVEVVVVRDGYNICKIISEKTFAMLVDEKIFLKGRRIIERNKKKMKNIFLCYFSVVSLNCCHWGGVVVKKQQKKANFLLLYCQS